MARSFHVWPSFALTQRTELIPPVLPSRIPRRDQQFEGTYLARTSPLGKLMPIGVRDSSQGLIAQLSS